jgi:hypothetical protein
VVFVADDLAGWLVGLLADAGRKKLTTLVLGSDQERALRQAATAAIQLTAGQLAASGGELAEQMAMVVSEVFGEPVPDAALAGQATLLQALQAGITAQLAVLDDARLTGTGRSSAELLGFAGGVLAEALAGHLVQEIMRRGSRGGPLAPLADQLNHDVTHLQGQRLEGMLARLAEQVTALAGAGSPAVVAGKPVRLLPRPSFLAGREELLAELDDRLAGGGGSGPRIMVLHGLGGAGKTSVAVEYAHRHLGEVGVAWQVPAGDAAVLAASLGELAARLGVREGPDGGDPVASVHAMLAAWPAGWLLVFDDCSSPADVQQVLPPAGDGRVLITSRGALWPPGQAVEVPVLDPGVAAEFLAERTGDPDEQAGAGLAEAVGGLPLALEQAAAYIQATGGSLAGYLASFRRRRADLLARGQPAGYSRTVATTWALAFAQLEHSSPGAPGLLRLLAFCAPEAVPLGLLLQPRPGAPRHPDRPRQPRPLDQTSGPWLRFWRGLATAYFPGRRATLHTADLRVLTGGSHTLRQGLFICPRCVPWTPDACGLRRSGGAVGRRGLRSRLRRTMLSALPSWRNMPRPSPLGSVWGACLPG